MKEKINKKPLTVLFFTIFVDMLGFGILIPVIPQLLANPSSSYFLLPQSYSVKQGYVLLGILLAVFPLAQFIAAPILGQLSDKYGRKKLLALSLLGTSLSYIIFAIGIILRNIPLLFFARAFDGITGGNISVAQASIADITEPKNRVKNFGLIGAAFGLGFILGPFLGGKLSDSKIYLGFNAVTPFWFAAVLAFLNVLSLLLFLPETHKTRIRSLRINWGRSFKNILCAFNLKNLKPLFITGFIFQSGFSFYVTFISVFLIVKFGFDEGNIGNYFAYVGLWVFFTQLIITRFVARRFKENKVLKISLIGAGLSVILLIFISSKQELFLFVPLFAIFNGLTQANLTGLVSRSAGSEIQGEILGINSSVQSFAQLIPPLLSGFIAAKINPVAPVVISSVLMIISGIIFFILYKPRVD